MIPSMVPNSMCVLEFLSGDVGVTAMSHCGSIEVCRINYSDVDILEVAGSGTRTYTTGGRLAGGGFGVKGALEGIAIAGIFNALTRKSAEVRDTVLNLRSGERQILMDSFIWEPAFLRVLLAPVYERIQAARGTPRSPLAPAGWYADPTQPTPSRYWDGGKWTDHTAPAL